jgi:alpha-amylase/alpha-mannosidase (GH57 family)
LSKLLFGVHMHQPVDNLDIAIKEAIELCYRPFFEVMSKFNKFKFALHSSGWILEYIKNSYPDIFENIKKCNIEFFTGGYYEPILASIDEVSRINQIKKLTNFIKENFNQTPKGLWLTERVWSDEIIKALKLNNIEYVIVDDEHILKANQAKIEGFWTTEEGGRSVDVFPINKELRYKIPFDKSEESINVVKKYKTSIMFDDLEKFGLWPKTNEWVYGEKWLEKFVEGILSDKDIEVMHFTEFHKQNRSLGLIYLPEVSYHEMNEWAKGKWKNFFVKYSESNRIHKRMLSFKSLQNESLFKAQSNDVLWHGVFGGIYLPNLRDNAYRYIIELEDYVNNESNFKDIECKGYKSLKLKNENIIAVFSQKGGSLVEFDDRKNKFNFQNTLTRREEAYYYTQNEKQATNTAIKTIHNINNIDETIKDKLVFDKYEKVSFIDFVDDECLANEIYDCRNETFIYPKISKKYKLIENGFEFEIVVNGGYKMELNLHFAHYNDITINKSLLKENELILSDIFEIEDFFTNKILEIKFDIKCSMQYQLLKTYSKSESGFDEIIQGITFIFEFDKREIKGSICLK